MKVGSLVCARTFMIFLSSSSRPLKNVDGKSNENEE
jgi:hypothetical protein